MKQPRAFVLLIFSLLAVFALPSSADAGDTLTRIKTRAKVRCGVSDGILGLSIKQAGGRWSGMDADFCRALAAAAPGDPGKVEVVPLATSARFPSLKAGEDVVWLMGVCERSPEGIRISMADHGLVDDFRRALPDFTDQGNVGSP
jgi:ABC-type amino acid transport substrate-binding protein